GSVRGHDSCNSLGMRVQVAPCERYRLRVTTWGPFPIGGLSPRGSGAAPHAVVLPGISADWRGLAPQIRALRGLGWTVHVVDLPGFALPPALKASDANVVQLVRHRASARPRALSARAIIWANQPRRWRKARALLPGGEQLGIRIDGPLTKLSEIPTLVLWGDEDRVISASDARRCKELPLAQVRIAHGVGHSLPLEVAGWANDHIAKFVAGLTTTELRAA